MTFYDTFEILGVLVFKLVQNHIGEITEDEIMKFEWQFITVSNKKEKSFLKITRKDIIDFCDANSKYLVYNRGLDKLRVKEICADTAFHFYWEYGRSAIHKYGNDILEEVWNITKNAIGEKDD